MTDTSASNFIHWHNRMCMRVRTAAAVVLIVAATPLVGPVVAHLFARMQ